MTLSKNMSFYVNDKKFNNVICNYKYEMEIYSGNLCIIINDDQIQIEHKIETSNEINIVVATKNFYDGIKIKIEINKNRIHIDDGS